MSKNNKFELIFNALGDAVFIHDLEGHFLEVNQTAADQLGYSKKELCRMSPQDIDDPEFAAQVEDRLKILQEKGEVTFETAHQTKQGKRIPIELNSKLIEYEGQPAVLSIARDITERKERERDLEKMNDLLVNREIKMAELKEELADFKK